MRTFARRCVLPLAVALVLLSNAACGGDAESASNDLREPSVDSSDTRAHRLGRLVGRIDSLSTLARGLRQVGLARELRRDGPFTLFAPTDRAFQRYWPGLDSLLAPAGSTAAAASAQPGSETVAESDTDSLRQVLQFHLVRGRFGPRGRLADSLRLETLADESLLLESASGNRLRLRVDGMPRPVPVRRTLEAQNGVLHVIGRPLRIPPPDTSSGGALRSSSATNTQTAAGN